MPLDSSCWSSKSKCLINLAELIKLPLIYLEVYFVTLNKATGLLFRKMDGLQTKLQRLLKSIEECRYKCCKLSFLKML